MKRNRNSWPPAAIGKSVDTCIIPLVHVTRIFYPGDSFIHSGGFGFRFCLILHQLSVNTMSISVLDKTFFSSDLPKSFLPM